MKPPNPRRYIGAAQQEDDGEPFAEKMARPVAQWRAQREEAARQALLERAWLACGRLDTITALLLLALFQQDAARVQTQGRAAANTLRVFDALRKQPLANIDALAQRTGLSFATVARAMDALQRVGVVQEITGRKRERVFAYRAYLDILNEGGEV